MLPPNQVEEVSTGVPPETQITPTVVLPETAAPSTTVLPETVAPPTTVLPETVAPSTTVLPETVAPSTTVLPPSDDGGGGGGGAGGRPRIGGTGMFEPQNIGMPGMGDPALLAAQEFPVVNFLSEILAKQTKNELMSGLLTGRSIA